MRRSAGSAREGKITVQIWGGLDVGDRRASKPEVEKYELDFRGCAGEVENEFGEVKEKEQLADWRDQ